MRNVEHGTIHPYILVLKGTADDYKWNIQKPDGTLYEVSDKAMAWRVAKSWSKQLKDSNVIKVDTMLLARTASNYPIIS